MESAKCQVKRKSSSLKHCPLSTLSLFPFALRHLRGSIRIVSSDRTPSTPDLRTMVAQARGGRVIRTPFLEASALDRRALAADGLRFAVHGGFTDPARVIYTLYPEHIPNVEDPVRVVRIDGDFPPEIDLEDLLVALQIPEDQLGDAREKQGDFLIATTAKGLKMLEATSQYRLRGQPIELEFAVVDASDLERSNKTRAVVVPSMRLDVIGAKGFGVSRAYFQQGIEGKKVRINGSLASSSTTVREGDTLIAEGLGRIEFKRVLNETKRGNWKLELEIHK